MGSSADLTETDLGRFRIPGGIKFKGETPGVARAGACAGSRETPRAAMKRIAL
jgi:hypothetical protein